MVQMKASPYLRFTRAFMGQNRSNQQLIDSFSLIRSFPAHP